LKLYPIAVVLLVWEGAARGGLVDPLFLPSFSGSMQALVQNFDLLAADAAYSLRRAFSGLLLGASVGVIIGMAMARYRAAEAFLDPLVSALFPTPKLALFPLLMVWLGLGEGSKVALIAISAFFPVVINTYAGMRGVDRFLVWNARTKGANELQMLMWVMVPAAMPFIFTGLRIATGYAFLLTVAAEMLAANNGLGFRIIYAQRTFEAETMYAGIVLVAALGFVVDRLVGWLGRHLIAWQDTET
jgi:ABC-type nitrate/sulfonate/bicarbonate transport system permease component